MLRHVFWSITSGQFLLEFWKVLWKTLKTTIAVRSLLQTITYIGLIQIPFEVDGKTPVAFRGLWIRSFVSRGTAQQIWNVCKREECTTAKQLVTLIFWEKRLFLQRATQTDKILYLTAYIFKRQAAKGLILIILFLHIHLRIKAP